MFYKATKKNNIFINIKNELVLKLALQAMNANPSHNINGKKNLLGKSQNDFNPVMLDYIVQYFLLVITRHSFWILRYNKLYMM